MIVRFEAPLARYRRLHVDACFHDVAHEVQPCSGNRAGWLDVWIGDVVEQKPQRHGLEFVVNDERNARCLRLHADAQRLRQLLIVVIAAANQRYGEPYAADAPDDPPPAHALDPCWGCVREGAEQRSEGSEGSEESGHRLASTKPSRAFTLTG